MERSLVQDNLRPNPAVLVGGTGAVVVVSVAMLPLPAAVASAVLGALMISGADVDARTLLLPNIVTWGGLGSGLIAAAALDPDNPWRGIAVAIARAGGTAFALASLQWCYARLRAREGLGLGDIKLAAAVGAWLPIEAIPLCFGLASGAALVAVLLARLRGEAVDALTKVPFGAFLCPALWLVFYGCVLPG